ncbi:undecaprenyldiphospho-muramoylpentapeptide beta-N-acetylglucosaminyltransferase [Speluncibacter jeojiensis]|uniref:UDP-N-acetylglucosamine--N-acetylmuramyl-(pentapeptide) pyrophosphoryl-undecaprenol N-acetylglucosamine transferase n=1 Tax=Speluncibacter jeojiensis TaxID=2710754 RepID=A0A9X4LXK2_9ACTN|nr:undecaprenyldiphospho-muramoylpentapeptide beta-N-acetylglucosaminyltransferase [Corynebacteriales bacterium D3-21]
MSSGDRALSVVVAGGGTAGHIEPALAVADALRELDPTVRVTALGTERGLETDLVPARGYPLELIPPVPLPRKPTLDLLRLPGRVRASVRRTRAVLDETQADVVVGFGGYVALPAYLAASRGLRRGRRRIPVVVHEANASAGIANKVGARGATRVLAAVPGSGLRGAQVVGIPVRGSITGLDRAGLRAQAREHFGLDPEAPVLLVFGGSQGARSLNEAVAGAARELGAAGISVLHAHGPKNTVSVDRDQAAPAYVTVPYLTRMDLAYAAADAVICRSGAMTVAEVSAVGLPAMYVPLPHGNGEQELNAKPVVAAGGGMIVADADLSPRRVVETMVPLLQDRRRLDAMSECAAGAGHRDAAKEIAKIVMDVARGQA